MRKAFNLSRLPKGTQRTEGGGGKKKTKSVSFLVEGKKDCASDGHLGRPRRGLANRVRSLCPGYAASFANLQMMSNWTLATRIISKKKIRRTGR